MLRFSEIAIGLTLAIYGAASLILLYFVLAWDNKGINEFWDKSFTVWAIVFWLALVVIISIKTSTICLFDKTAAQHVFLVQATILLINISYIVASGTNMLIYLHMAVHSILIVGCISCWNTWRQKSAHTSK